MVLFFNLFAGAGAPLNEPHPTAAVVRITRRRPGCEQFKSLKRNPKSEGRNPKEIRNPKAEVAKLPGVGSALDTEAAGASVSRNDHAGRGIECELRVSDFFRTSDCGLRISGLRGLPFASPA
jgi:hypothetical protein